MWNIYNKPPAPILVRGSQSGEPLAHSSSSSKYLVRNKLKKKKGLVYFTYFVQRCRGYFWLARLNKKIKEQTIEKSVKSHLFRRAGNNNFILIYWSFGFLSVLQYLYFGILKCIHKVISMGRICLNGLQMSSVDCWIRIIIFYLNYRDSKIREIGDFWYFMKFKKEHHC